MLNDVKPVSIGDIVRYEDKTNDLQIGTVLDLEMWYDACGSKEMACVMSCHTEFLIVSLGDVEVISESR